MKRLQWNVVWIDACWVSWAKKLQGFTDKGWTIQSVQMSESGGAIVVMYRRRKPKS